MFARVCVTIASTMTSEESDDPSQPDGVTATEGADPTTVDRLASEVERLESELDATKERLRAAEKNVRWMAQRQASETGRSICPRCNAGGALTVERTATGKQKVECSNCGERLV